MHPSNRRWPNDSSALNTTVYHNNPQRKYMELNDERILRLFTVKEITGLSKSSIYAMESAGKFPSRVSLGPRSVGWKRSEVLVWINARQRVVGAQ